MLNISYATARRALSRQALVPVISRCLSINADIIAANTFWSTELKPGTSVTANVPEGKVLTVVLAALSGQGAGPNVVKVNVTAADQPPATSILCTLRTNSCEQFAFETIFSDKSTTVFSLHGDEENSVFLTGHYKINDDIYDGDEDFDLDDYIGDDDDYPDDVKELEQSKPKYPSTPTTTSNTSKYKKGGRKK